MKGKALNKDSILVAKWKSITHNIKAKTAFYDKG